MNNLLELLIADQTFCDYFFSWQTGKKMREVTTIEAIQCGFTYIVSLRHDLPDNAIDLAIIHRRYETIRYLLSRGYEVSRLGYSRAIRNHNIEILNIIPAVPRWWVILEIERAVETGDMYILSIIFRPEYADPVIIYLAQTTPYQDIRDYILSTVDILPSK